VSVAVTACVRAVDVDSEITNPPPQSPAAVPNLIGLTMQSAADDLAALGIGDATVVFPSEEVTLALDATYMAGAYQPARVKTYTIPAREVALREAATGHYVVDAQSIAPGGVLGAESLELTAVPAPDGVPLWATAGHAIEVERTSAEDCFECHHPDYCSQCHIAMLK